MTYRYLFGTAVLMVATAVSAAAAPAKVPVPSLVVLPASVTLTGPKASQRLVVEARGTAFVGDLTAKARWVSSNPKVATVDAAGRVRPVGDGTATLTAVVEGKRALATVRVKDSGKPWIWSFTNHIQPVLTKTGCNSGACHGASAGKGGLKLTLRGYDPNADHSALTRQVLGRRIVPAAPTQSLVLQKPVMTVPHGGGMRFKPNSAEYGMIAQWIAAGSPAPTGRETKIERLEVLPAEAVLRPGVDQQVVVRAHFSDGHAEDVTPWVKYGTSDDGVAAVDDSGKVTVKGYGEAAITLWYLNKVAFTRILSPYKTAVPAETFARSERRNFIDGLVLKKLQALNIPPSGPASDAEFLRRAYLDAAGILPTEAETAAFLADSAPDKRAKLVEGLLARPEFTDYWSYKISDVLLVSSRKLPTRGMWAFYNWIRQSVAENKGWDRLAREVLTASGSTLTNGAANYYVLHKDPIDATETTTQAFLGMALTCSRCHNHPLEKWTLNDYYGMANLFARVRLKNGELAGETQVFAADSGDVNHLVTAAPMPPRPLDGVPMDLDDPADRRVHLANWMTAPENPYFARAFVNRVWRALMGRGLVEAEDDLRLTNPPSNEELLAAVSQDFVKSGFDLRHLVRTIMNSAAYQRSSVPVKGNAQDQKFYSTYISRRLPAEVMLDAISQATGVPTEFPGYPRGTRALQLPDSQVTSEFLSAFGRPQRVQTCSCERQEEPSVAQALHLSNGSTINGKLRAAGSVAEKLAAEKLTNEALLDRIYVLALSRKPAGQERERVLAAMRDFPAEGPGRREAIEDLLSAMLTTKEFLFNH